MAVYLSCAFLLYLKLILTIKESRKSIIIRKQEGGSINLKNRTLSIFGIAFLVGVLVLNPLQTKAVTTYDITTSNMDFDDHDGARIQMGGKDVFCIQYGVITKPNYNEYEIMSVGSNNIKLGDYPSTLEDDDYVFAGWGTWELNDTATGATQESTENIPDDNATTKYLSYTIPLTSSVAQGKAGKWMQNEINSLSFLNYYLSDTDIDTVRANQALTWEAQYHKMYTTGASRNNMRVVFDAAIIPSLDGRLGTSYLTSYNLCKEFIWKMNNLRTIPSFSYTRPANAMDNPIELYWDDGIQAYTATVNDENGVLKYYDFEIDGVTCTENEDGTLTITSQKALSNVATNAKSVGGEIQGARDELLPEDCKLATVIGYHWEKEEKVDHDEDGVKDNKEKFTYTFLKKVTGHKNKSTSDEEWGCKWKCTTTYDSITDCTGSKDNCKDKDGACGCYHCDNDTNVHKCDSNCYYVYTCSNSSCSPNGYNHSVSKCPGSITASWHCSGTLNAHDCDSDCTTHPEDCKHYKNCDSYNGNTTASVVTNKTAKSACTVSNQCTEQHYEIATANKYTSVTAKYPDWQDIVLPKASETKLVDPVYAYIGIKTVEHEEEAETSVKTQLIDEEGNVVDHIIPGEMYKVRYIYTYKGESKGFKIVSGNNNVPSYSFPYNTRLTTTALSANGSEDAIINQKASYSNGTMTLPKYTLDIDLTDVMIYGDFKTLESDGSIYKWSSDNEPSKYNNNSWDDKIALDALTTVDMDDGYTPKTEDEIKASSLHSENISKVEKSTNAEGKEILTIEWIYESEYEVFNSPVCIANAFIFVGNSKNYTKTYFDEYYNYAEDAELDNVGGDGYFGRHVVTTKNAKYETYANDITMWQTDVDISFKTSVGPVLNTGAGITSPVDISSVKKMNYNLYYTVILKNDTAHIFNVYKSRANNVTKNATEKEKEINVDDIIELDITTKYNISYSGSNVNGYIGTLYPIDHIRTGETHIQRSIPASLNVTETGTALFKVDSTLNSTRTVYEYKYKKPTVDDQGSMMKATITFKNNYANNSASSTDTVYSANNPKLHKPYGIVGCGTYDTKTSYGLVLANNAAVTIHDRDTRSNYTEYAFDYNTAKADNKVTYPSYRHSVAFFKYSNTNYRKDGNNNFSVEDGILNSGYSTIDNTLSTYTDTNQTQTEKYYISQVLFKSNYTYKHNYGENEDGWVDMVEENDKAIVAAGQGFELQIKVVYSNSLLQNYVSRYYGTDDAETLKSNIASSRLSGKTKQFCNVSYLTGYELLDKYSKYKIKGSNVFYDLYVCMSDNEDAVYSYSGIYDTPQIFDAEIVDVQNDTTTIVYTMKKSTENGVASSFQNMKFFTDQLAPDVESPGIVEGNYDVTTKGEHSITIWTPTVAATGFEYPSPIQDRYIGDAIELGYTIKTTGADDSIVHIVQ